MFMSVPLGLKIMPSALCWAVFCILRKKLMICLITDLVCHYFLHLVPGGGGRGIPFIFGCVLKPQAIEGAFQNRKSDLFSFYWMNIVWVKRYLWLSKYYNKHSSLAWSAHRQALRALKTMPGQRENSKLLLPLTYWNSVVRFVQFRVNGFQCHDLLRTGNDMPCI